MPVTLFCFPFAGGSSALFHKIKRDIQNVDIQVMEYPGHGRRFSEPLKNRFADLENNLYDSLKPLLKQPYAIYGHSLGALIGFELTRKIIRNGDPAPQNFILSGRRAPHIPPSMPQIHHLERESFIEKFEQYYQPLPSEIKNEPSTLALFLPIIKADISVLEDYQFDGYNEILPCPITAIAGDSDLHSSLADVKLWKKYTSQFNCYEIKSDHYSFFSDNIEFTKLVSKILN
tara:strand:+ start:53449 stop:54141 length:693 start_codon:yes stop_codon:yes gene_type:complete